MMPFLQINCCLTPRSTALVRIPHIPPEPGERLFYHDHSEGYIRIPPPQPPSVRWRGTAGFQL